MCLLCLLESRSPRAENVLNAGRAQLWPHRAGLGPGIGCRRLSPTCLGLGRWMHSCGCAHLEVICVMQDLLRFTGDHLVVVVVFALVMFLLGRTRS